MALKDKSFKTSYTTDGSSELVEGLLVNALSEATLYKRSVGYFNKGALISIFRGIESLRFKCGKIKIICSPQLTDEDVKAIHDGYLKREEVIENACLKTVRDTFFNDDEMNGVEYITKLIASGILDIKIALKNDLGIYHDKLGIIEDENGDKLCFVGSLNETYAAYSNNYEKVRVFMSWKSDDQFERVADEDEEFNRLWNDKNNSVTVYDFTTALQKELVIKIDEHQKQFGYRQFSEQKKAEKFDRPGFKEPDWFEARHYQVEAINSWELNNWKGMLSLATGTGKTLTSLFGVSKLWKKMNFSKMLVIIVVPYIALVEQWEKDVKEFANDIVKVNSTEKNWEKKMHETIEGLKYGVIDVGVVITTIGSLQTKRMQDMLLFEGIKTVLIADECHNYGTDNALESIPKADYRIGLSATPERHFDDEGTEKLKEFFGGIVYEFSLERAIEEGFLVPYYYKPITVRLTEDEQEKYNEISAKITKLIEKDSSGKTSVRPGCNKTLELLLIQRSRVIAGAREKMPVLFDTIEKEGSSFNLVYCGSTTISDGTADDEGQRQVKYISSELHSRGILNTMYTSNEDTKEREDAIELFRQEMSPVLIAIKCLDEGVNIPEIRTAYLVASTTNKKEFIQRRGRVLRTTKNGDKKFAQIYDFITLPYSDDGKGYGMVRRELIRYKEFMDLAKNKLELQDEYCALEQKYCTEKGIEDYE